MKIILFTFIFIVFYSCIFFIFFSIIYEYSEIYGGIFYFCIYSPNLLFYIIIYDFSGFNKLLIVFEGILILICLFIYTEIIELNFCELNKNTRRNILKREMREKMMIGDLYNDEQNNNRLEISPGYIVDFNVELKEKNI